MFTVLRSRPPAKRPRTSHTGEDAGDEKRETPGQRSVQCYCVCPILLSSKWEASKSASCGSWDCRPRRLLPRVPDESKRSSAGPNRPHPDEQPEGGCGKAGEPMPTSVARREHRENWQEKAGRRAGVLNRDR